MDLGLNLALENSVLPPDDAVGLFILREDGTYLLREDGTKFLLET